MSRRDPGHSDDQRRLSIATTGRSAARATPGPAGFGSTTARRKRPEGIPFDFGDDSGTARWAGKLESGGDGWIGSGCGSQEIQRVRRTSTFSACTSIGSRSLGAKKKCGLRGNTRSPEGRKSRTVAPVAPNRSHWRIFASFLGPSAPDSLWSFLAKPDAPVFVVYAPYSEPARPETDSPSRPSTHLLLSTSRKPPVAGIPACNS